MSAPDYCEDTSALDPASAEAGVCASFAFTGETNAGLDVFFLIFSATMVFFMQESPHVYCLLTCD